MDTLSAPAILGSAGDLGGGGVVFAAPLPGPPPQVTGWGGPRCAVSSPEARADIAAYLGVDVGQATQRVARLLCAGGRDVAPERADYLGLPTCKAAAARAGGGKGGVGGGR